jgi:hypothetical protein
MEMTLVKSLHSGAPDVIHNTRTCKASARQQAIRIARLARRQLGIKLSALQVLFGLHPSAVHVCSLYVHVIHALGEPCRGLIFRCSE